MWPWSAGRASASKPKPRAARRRSARVSPQKLKRTMARTPCARSAACTASGTPQSSKRNLRSSGQT
eukprot:996311-Alexandrium_andersonii.AAC.1